MDYTQALISMFIILGPFGNIFIFESILNSLGVIDKNKRSLAIKKAFLIAYLTWIPIFIAGLYILKFFGITIESFKIAGGILLMLIALDILRDSTPKISNIKHQDSEIEKVIVTPMAIPLLTGPGVITTTLLYKTKTVSLLEDICLFVIFSIAFVLAFLVVYNGEKIIDRLGRTKIILLNRLMGLILLAIAVEFIVNGIKQIFLV